MPDKELTIENLGEEIKHLIETATGKYKGSWFVHKLRSCGFSLQINIMLVEEEDPKYCVMARKPVYRRPKTIIVSSGFTADDFDFFQKYKISPPHEPPAAAKQPEEENLLLRIKGLIMGTLDGETGCYYQLMLLKYGAGLRINLMAVQENNPQLIVRRKIMYKTKKSGNAEFTEPDQAFLKKNRLIGF